MISERKKKKKRSLETHYHSIMDITHHIKSLLGGFKLDYRILDNNIKRSHIGHQSNVSEKQIEQNKMKEASVYIQ
jgi:hypothetical protein